MSSASEVALLRDTLEVVRRAQAALLERRPHIANYEPIAVVGCGCRFPGGARSPEAYWRLLQEGFDGTSPHPHDRWRWQDYFAEDPFREDAIYTRRGGYIDEVTTFDARFFGISPREAERMDPQQRLLLEVTWEALEHAGLRATNLRKSRTGVFIGMSTEDYADVSVYQGDKLAHIDMHSSLGLSRSVAAGRIASFLGVQGPTLQLDTACSSSLMAVHLAAQSLRLGECTTALAGGVNLILSPVSILSRCRMQALSRDGRCKTFAADADGYGQAEGAGVVVLKRLTQAQADGDPILAVIYGSAANHNGPSSGITVPNQEAQTQVIREALRAASLSPRDIDYIEAHGTGTIIGDPLEVNALTEVFAESRDPERPLYLGSAKANIGHLEAAAGVACLVKALFMVRDGVIPPHIHAKDKNPRIDWSSIPFQVPEKRLAWPHSEARRLVGVSSFGISGTNVHLIVGSPSHDTQSALTEVAPQGWRRRNLAICPISAASEQALAVLAKRYRDNLGASDFQEWAATVARSRATLPQRAAVVASSSRELAEGLDAIASGTQHQRTFQSAARQSEPCVFLFSGQGSQYSGMGRQLWEVEPSFRESLQRSEEVLASYLPTKLTSLLFDPAYADNLDETQYTQPLLCALQIALVECWSSWGVAPDYVIGHSLGEYAAAYCAGMLTAADTLSLVAERGRLMAAVQEAGGMVAVSLAPEEVSLLIEQSNLNLEIGALNAPQRTTVSGRRAEVEEFCILLKRDKPQVSFSQLAVSQAFHSACMDSILSRFSEVCSRFTFQRPRIPLISNLTGEIGGDEIRTPAYWVKHLRKPVLFMQGIRTLERCGVTNFVEIGPRAVLLTLARETLEGSSLFQRCAFLPSLRPGTAEAEQIAETAAQLFCRGRDLDWDKIYPDQTRSLAHSLPHYPWERKSYWFQPGAERANGQSSGSSSSELWRAGFSREEQETVERYLRLVGLSSSSNDSVKSTLPPVPSYEVLWERPSSMPVALEQCVIPERVLVICDSQNLMEPILNASRVWRDHGCAAFVATLGAEYSHSQDRVVTADLTRSDQVTRLFQDVLSQGGTIPHILLITGDQGTCYDAGASLSRTFRSIREVLKYLSRIARPRDHLVTLVTTHTSPAMQSALWSLGRSLSLECPRLMTSSLRVEREPSELVETLISLLTHPALNSTGENWLESSRSERLVGRLQTREWEAARGQPLCSSSKSYLITGGSGVSGGALAEWLCDQGAGYVLVTGRREASAISPTLRELMAQKDRKVVYENIDVTSCSQLKQLFSRFGADLPPLGGVFHLAGVAVGASFTHSSDKSIEAILGAKVRGAQLLDDLSRGHAPELFVLFSSLSSVLGAKGHSVYSAANGFLDGLVEERRRSGLPGIALSFGPFAEGSLADEELLEGLRRQGVQPLSMKEVTLATEQAIREGAGHRIVASIAWGKFADQYHAGGTQHLVRNLTEVAKPQSLHQEQMPKEVYSSPEKQEDMLRTGILECIAAIMKYDSLQEVDPNLGFFEMGMDSLMVVELKDKVQALVSVEIDRTTVFNHPTVNSLLDYLACEVLKWRSKVRPDSTLRPQHELAAKSSEVANPDNREQTLTLDDLEALLDDEQLRLNSEV